MAEPFAVAGADYLEQMLRAAMHVPAAAADPSGGRVVAKLMVALATKREDERLEAYLSCSPGRRSVYDVTCYDEADHPASQVSDLRAGQAVRAAIGFSAARPECTIVVVARDDTGGERCVLVVRGPVATYQFPEVSVDNGEPAPSSSPAPAIPTIPPPTPTVEKAEPRPPAPAPAPAPAAISPLPPDPKEAEQWLALTERLDSLPTTDQVVAALGNALAGMTTDLERVSSLPTSDEVVTALRDLLAGMTIELDATAIEDVIHAALDEMPHGAAPLPSPAPVPIGAPPVENVMMPSVAAIEGPTPLPGHSAAPTSGPVAPTATINATPAAERIAERLPESVVPTDRRGSGRAKVASPRVNKRPPSDRAVDDPLVLVALATRRC